MKREEVIAMECPFYNKLKENNLLEITDESTVGELTSKIENFFNLPEGIVIIRHPDQDKFKFKATAKLSTVRREWGYED